MARFEVLLLATLRSVHGFGVATSHHCRTRMPRTSQRPWRSSVTSLSASEKRQSNPFVSLMSGFASAVIGDGASPSTLSADAESRITSTVSHISWEKLRSTWENDATPDEQKFRQNLPLGYGIASPFHNTRLYDETNKEEDIRVTFYRDSASWCPYCQKVWIALETKRIPYRVERVNMRCYGDKPASFLQIQRNGNIPVAMIDGKIYGESNDILEALESLFPGAKSLSPADEERQSASELFRLERLVFSAWMYWLTSSERYKADFCDVLATVDKKLGDTPGPFFLGDRITLVDVQFAPFLERMCASLLFFKGFQIRFSKGEASPYPNINEWFNAMEELESYQVTKSDYYTHCWDLPPQLGGCTYESGGEPYEKAINGERAIGKKGGSWELLLQKDNGGIEPDWEFCGDEAAARREAAERLTWNHENVAKFAARGAGKKGSPPVMAALADPNATPSQAVVSTVDASLRCIAMALLKGESEAADDMKALAASIVNEGGDSHRDGVVKSLSYLRDRVGVPRDMRLPAARQFRAHLNWSLGIILKA